MYVGLWVNEIMEQDANAKKIKSDERLKQIILAGIQIASSNSEQNENINSPSNAMFHQKLIVSIIKHFVPLYAEVISQGVKEEIFNVSYPNETAEMILTLSNFYFDMDLFNWNEETMISKVTAFEEVITLILGVKNNTFSFISKSLKGELK